MSGKSASTPNENEEKFKREIVMERLEKYLGDLIDWLKALLTNPKFYLAVVVLANVVNRHLSVPLPSDIMAALFDVLAVALGFDLVARRPLVWAGNKVADQIVKRM